VPAYFSGKNGKSAMQTYNDGIEWKRNLHHTNNTRLIEVYAYEKLEGCLLEMLETRLKRAGVIFQPKSAEQIWQEINGTEKQKLDRVAELFGTIITLIKSNECTIEDVRARNYNMGSLRNVKIVLELIEPIYNHYQNRLKNNCEIDFNDMINKAADYVRRGKFFHRYRFVIVDEYQDISQARYKMLHALRTQRDYRLFCVGDDWQSIYRFNGSDIGFILHFEKYWGSAEISRIETTYRFPQELIELSSNFIMENPTQKRKMLRSATGGKGFPVEEISVIKECYAAERIAERLKDLPRGSSVLFVGRYRFDVRILDGHSAFEYRYKVAEKRTEVTYNMRKDLTISFMTAHGAKGLQADYVFVLNNKAYGMAFPSQIAESPILKLLMDNCDSYPFAEERRLFYVAITRALHELHMILDQESPFFPHLP